MSLAFRNTSRNNPSIPVVKSYFSPEALKPFKEIVSLIIKGNFASKNIPSLLELDSIPGSIYEPVSVFKDMLKILNGEDVHSSLINMIDSCIVGVGICHGSTDNRAIFNWFLTHVLPYSVYNKVPEVIYSPPKIFPEAWTYSKA